jgi:hypothetical protein
MSAKSGFPFRLAGELDPELVKYLDRIGKPAAAVSSVSASATTTELATAFNALLASLRAAGKMDT